MIHLNTNRLKCSLCRMSALLFYLHWNGIADDVSQFLCCLNRFLLSCDHNIFCNILRKFIFTIIFNNMVEFTFCIFIYNLICCQFLTVIHTHIQWCIKPVRKPSFSGVQLKRRNTKIQSNTVCFFYTKIM